MIIARSHASAVPRARVIRPCVSQPSGCTLAIDNHATHRASRATRPPAFLLRVCILRLQDTELESLEEMLRLLLIALPLVVALPAVFVEHEVNALKLEVQSPREVRSPPESRPHPPAATRDQHNALERGQVAAI